MNKQKIKRITRTLVYYCKERRDFAISEVLMKIHNVCYVFCIRLSGTAKRIS